MVEDGYNNDDNDGMVVLRTMREGSERKRGVLITNNLNGETRALSLPTKKLLVCFNNNAIQFGKSVDEIVIIMVQVIR